MTKTLVKVDQNAFPNKTVPVTPLLDLSDFVRSESRPDTISAWAELYFRIEVTTSERSRQEQRRDLRCFLAFMVGAVGDELHDHWTPRLSRAFIDTLRQELEADDSRRWSDCIVNRMRFGQANRRPAERPGRWDMPWNGWAAGFSVPERIR